MDYFTTGTSKLRINNLSNIFIVTHLKRKFSGKIVLKSHTQPDPRTQTIARTFSYTTFAILIGAMIYLMTNNLIPLTLRPDWFGTVALAGFGLVYGNVSFFISRRYMRKQYAYLNYPYVIALILTIPAILLIRIKGDVFFELGAEIFFYITLLAGVLIGAYLGIQKGQKQAIDS